MKNESFAAELSDAELSIVYLALKMRARTFDALNESDRKIGFANEVSLCDSLAERFIGELSRREVARHRK